jgi:hypothetical protein
MYLFNFAAPRTFIGMTKVVNYIELTHDGDKYDSLADFEVYDVNGNLVTTGHNIAQATRCTAVTTVPALHGDWRLGRQCSGYRQRLQMVLAMPTRSTLRQGCAKGCSRS